MFELIGFLVLAIIVVLSLTPWRPRGSAPISFPGWTRIPLNAFAVFTVGPSVLAPILYVLQSAGAELSQLIPHGGDHESRKHVAKKLMKSDICHRKNFILGC
jgi:hypothetical protein